MHINNDLLAHQTNADKALNILFLSRSGFIGKHMVRQCIDVGHTVTLFNQGKRAEKYLSDLETINRDPGKNKTLKELEERKWDVIVDTSGYVSRNVEGPISLLKKLTPHYLLISKRSIFSGDFPQRVMTTGSSVGPSGVHKTVIDHSIGHPGVRITAQLTDLESGLDIWSKVYDRSLNDTLVDKDNVASEILDALRVV